MYEKSYSEGYLGGIAPWSGWIDSTGSEVRVILTKHIEQAWSSALLICSFKGRSMVPLLCHRGYAVGWHTSNDTLLNISCVCGWGGVTQYSFAAALSVSYAEGLRATHISNWWCSTVACLEATVHFMGYHFFFITGLMPSRPINYSWCANSGTK